MSVHTVGGKGSMSYRVRWRDETGRMRSRTFSRKRDADDYDAKVRLAKRQGELAELDIGRERLSEFIDREWWPKYAEPELAASTRSYYKSVLDRLVKPELGSVQLRRITPQRVSDFRADLRERDVSEETIRKTLSLLQGVMERAVEWGRIHRNPVRSIKKGRPQRRRIPQPLAPLAVEKIRANLLKDDRPRDAALVSVLAYAGLRPGEALALRWSDVGTNTLNVDRAVSLGEEKSTKTGRGRTVRLLVPLRDDLRGWRRLSAPANEGTLLFPRRDGMPWVDTDYRNWRRRRFDRAAKAAGVKATPYTLRHSFASLLFQEGEHHADIAAQMGHDLQVLYGTYTHVIEELRGRKSVRAETEIERARKRLAAGNGSR
jgi:integrase